MRRERKETEPLRLRCFQCSEGCIHLTCGNATLTFSPDQFRALADVICAVRRELDVAGGTDWEMAETSHAPVM